MYLRSGEYVVLILFELVFLGLAWQAIIIGDSARFLGVSLSMALVCIPPVIEHHFSVQLPFGTKTAAASALLLHVAGGINRYYWLYAPFYDKVAHCVSGLALGLLIFSFFLFLDLCGIRVPFYRISSGIIILVLLLGAAWEVSEYFIDFIVSSSYNGGVTDSVLDMAANTLGSLFAVLFAHHAVRQVPAGKDLSWILSGE